MMSGSSISEDCLYLNIWASKSPKTGRKAVMVFVHGGGFSTGGTWLVNGTTLAQTEDVIVVAVSYRLSIFGFPDAPGLERNLGLLDIRMALEWVRDNIASFGGDPGRILLSAGSMACDMYSAAWRDDPIVSAIIGESGTAITENFNVQYNGKYWQQVATKLGCTGTSAVNCVKNKSEMEVYNAIPMGGFPFPYFAPTVDNKTLWSIADNEARNRQGLFARIPPYVYGVNVKEFGLASSDARYFGCPANKQAAARSAAGAQLWRYQFYKTFGPFGHGSEMPYVFGATQDPLSTYVMKAWADLAKKGASGLQDLGWPQYSRHSTVIRLGYGSEVSPSMIGADELNLHCMS